MALFGLQATEVALASMTDAELIRQLWRQIGDIPGHRRSDDLYYTATEVLERFAAEAEWAVEEADRRREASPDRVEDELASARDYRERRRRARESLATFHEEVVA